VLAKVRCPVLALGGDKDTQVDAALNLAAIERALKKGRNRRARVETLAGHNHLLQSGAKTGGLEEYVQISETVSPQALSLIGEWIAEQVRPRPAR
jgi:hypothetical protein